MGYIHEFNVGEWGCGCVGCGCVVWWWGAGLIACTTHKPCASLFLPLTPLPLTPLPLLLVLPLLQCTATSSRATCCSRRTALTGGATSQRCGGGRGDARETWRAACRFCSPTRPSSCTLPTTSTGPSTEPPPPSVPRCCCPPPQVSDFGLSRALDYEDPSHTGAHGGADGGSVSLGGGSGSTLGGTIAYTAPETFAHNCLKKPADVYAYGIMRECLPAPCALRL